jgi:DNA-binding transcriptional regulator YiaG
MAMARPTRASAASATAVDRANGAEPNVQEMLGQIRRDLGLTDAMIAGSLGVSSGIARDWRLGLAMPTAEATSRVRALADLSRHIQETFVSDAIERWLQSPNPVLGDVTPVEAIQAGRIGAVEAALETIDSGIFL